MTVSANLRGAGLMTASMVAFTVNDTFMKALSDELPVFQAIFLRGIGTVLCLIVLCAVTGQLRQRISRADRRLVLIRSLAEVGAAASFIIALFNMPIANVTAIISALPLTITLGAALVFKEPVGWRRFVAIGVGMVGVLLIVRPGGADFNSYSVLALGAVVCVTVRDLAARRMSVQTPTLLVALAAAIAVMIGSGVASSFTPWAMPSATGALQLFAAMVCVLVGYVFSVAAMRVGEIGFVAPFRYASLLAALVLGWAVFGEWPAVLTLVGAGIVVATGLFTLYRERHIRRRVVPRVR